MTYVVNVANNLDESIDVYSIKLNASGKKEYVNVAAVSASSTGVYTPTEVIEDLYFVRVKNGMPLLNTATSLFSDTEVSIRDSNKTQADEAFSFYQSYIANPSGQDASALNSILKDATDVVSMEANVDSYLKANGYGFTYVLFTAISYWAQNDARAWTQGGDYTLYCYNYDKPSAEPSLINFSTDGSIGYRKFKGFEAGGGKVYEEAVALSLADNCVSSTGSTKSTGYSFNPTLTNLSLDAKANYELVLIGTHDGDSVVAQPNLISSDKTYSLEKVCKNIGVGYPKNAPDIIVYDYYHSTVNGVTTITGKIDISKTSFDDGVLENVLTILSDTEYTFMVQLDVGVNLGAGTLSLSLTAGDIEIPVSESKTLELKDAEIKLSVNAVFKFVVFEIMSTLPFSLFNKKANADLSMTIDNLEAQVGVVIQGDDSAFELPAPIQGISIDELGVSMGLFFKPPSLVFGVESKFHIGDSANKVVSLDDDTLTVVCQVEDEVPNPLYISFYIPELSIDQVWDIFTDKTVSTGIPIQFSDLSFIWMENPMEPVALPDGSLSSVEYGFSAFADLFGLTLYGVLDIGLDNGIHGTITMSPFELGSGLLNLKGDGKSISVKVDSNGNIIKNNYIPKTTAEKSDVSNATSRTLVTAGGPELTISSSGPEYLTLDAELDFIGFSDKIDATIGKSGITFDLDFGGVISSKMNCSLTNYQNFSGSFSFGPDWELDLPTVGGVSLGKITIQDTVSATIAIAASKSDIDFTVSGAFDFEGLKRSFSLTLDVGISGISDVLSAILKWVESNISELFNDIIGDVDKWLGLVNNGVVAIAKDATKITNTIKHAFGVTIKDVGGLVSQFSYEVNNAADAFKSVFNPVAADMSNALHQACGATANATAQAMKAVGYSANDVAKAMEVTFNASADSAAKILESVGYSANAAANAIEGIFTLNPNELNKALQEAGYAANDIASAFEEMGGAFEKAGEDIINALNPTKW